MGKLAIGVLEGPGLRIGEKEISICSVCFLSSLFIPEHMHLVQLESKISQREEEHENSTVWQFKSKLCLCSKVIYLFHPNE